MCKKMTEFNKIQEIWNLQTDAKNLINSPEIIAKAEKHAKTLKQNHYWTVGIISVTVLILLFYFFWINAHQWNALTPGLSIMIGMLITRIALEMHSARKLQSIKPDLTVLHYTDKVKRFYHWRKKIHYLLTPIIYVSYFIGFTLLLPSFKANFSSGFYLYCLISGYGFFLVFGYFLIRQINKEMKILKLLNQIN